MKVADWNWGDVFEMFARGCQKAWAQFGGPLAPDGHFTTFDQTLSMQPGQGETWGAWNGAFVRETFGKQVGGWLEPWRNAEGHLTAMSPANGNAMLQYARLNVNDGLCKLYEEPWNERHFDEPLVFDASHALDFSRAAYLPDHKALILSFCSFDGFDQPVELEIANVRNGGGWQLEIDGIRAAHGIADRVETEGAIDVRCAIAGFRLRLDASTPLSVVLRLL
ncbi:hypothetical protein [Parasphingorhabdus sp.]|uniref:hypothetical protein n=1 Tax=Parasphingorhabdus sp. TaxID=2709688 RepID=UPI0032EB8E9C